MSVSLEDLSGERVRRRGDWGNAQASDAGSRIVITDGVLGEGEFDANSIEFRPVSVGPDVGRENGGFRKDSSFQGEARYSAPAAARGAPLAFAAIVGHDGNRGGGCGRGGGGHGQGRSSVEGGEGGMIRGGLNIPQESCGPKRSRKPQLGDDRWERSRGLTMRSITT